jgi:hypothetical protein
VTPIPSAYRAVCALILALVGSAGCGTGDNAGQPVTETPMEARDLWRRYSRNQSSADRDFKGKTVVVTGTVQSVAKKPAMLIKFDVGETGIGGVQATFAAPPRPELAAGMTLIVRCLCEGRFGPVLLVNCVMEKGIEK